jgi:hypothetical protein
VAAAGRALVDAWRRHGAELTELRLPDPDETLTGLEGWTGTLDGENPALTILTAAGAPARNRLAGARALALAELEAAEKALADLVEQRERLQRGEHDPPPVPYTRPADVRDDRAGAPLWQAVDFHEGMGEADRAGLEAALEAAGLLDAWVTPDGRLLDPGTHDVVVTAGAAVTPNLGAALRPAVDRDDAQAAQLADATVAAVLAGIGLGRSGAGTWVEQTGRWRLGVAEGAWAKPAASFVGRGAREAARRRRLAEVTQAIAATEAAGEAARQACDAVEGASAPSRPSWQTCRTSSPCATPTPLSRPPPHSCASGWSA